MQLVVLGALWLAVAACGDDDKPAPAPEPAHAAPARPDAASPDATTATPRDSRLASLFNAGRGCTWDRGGIAHCSMSAAIAKLAYDNLWDKALAAECAAALRDPEPTTRGLAADCLRGFHSRTKSPILGVALDAFEAETDPSLRVAIAQALVIGNAREAGIEPRVIALVKQLVEHDSDDTAADLLGLLFPQYVLDASDAPSKPAGDLALALARKAGPHTQTRALWYVTQLADRKPEVCAALRLALASDHAMEVVETLTTYTGCPAAVAAAVDLIADQMKAGSYANAMTAFVQKVDLTKPQQAKLRAASKLLVAKAKESQAAEVKTLAAMLRP